MDKARVALGVRVPECHRNCRHGSGADHVAPRAAAHGDRSHHRARPREGQRRASQAGHRQARLLVADLDDVAGLQDSAGDVAELAVDQHVPVRDHLPGADAVGGEAEAVDDVVLVRLSREELAALPRYQPGDAIHDETQGSEPGVVEANSPSWLGSADVAGQVNTALAMDPRTGLGRFRVNAFVQQGRVGLVLRTITTTIPKFDDLGLPHVLKDVSMTKRGLVIFVGGTGSGKSTSLAAMIGHRNENSYGHIITIEDPVE